MGSSRTTCPRDHPPHFSSSQNGNLNDDRRRAGLPRALVKKPGAMPGPGGGGGKRAARSPGERERHWSPRLCRQHPSIGWKLGELRCCRLQTRHCQESSLGRDSCSQRGAGRVTRACVRGEIGAFQRASDAPPKMAGGGGGLIKAARTGRLPSALATYSDLPRTLLVLASRTFEPALARSHVTGSPIRACLPTLRMPLAGLASNSDAEEGIRLSQRLRSAFGRQFNPRR